MSQQTNMTAVEWLFDNLNISEGSKDIKAFEQAKQMEKEQTKISDEEIWNASIKYDNGAMLETPMVHFQQGAFWYREQLKNK